MACQTTLQAFRLFLFLGSSECRVTGKKLPVIFEGRDGIGWQPVHIQSVAGGTRRMITGAMVGYELKLAGFFAAPTVPDESGKA